MGHKGMTSTRFLVKSKFSGEKRTAYKLFLKDIESFKLEKVYSRLRNKLSLRQQRLNHEALVQALDSAADDYVSANDLYLISVDANDKFLLKYEMRMSELAAEAHGSLEKDKKAKKITSQITEALKRAWISKHYKKEFEDLENEKREMDIVKRRMEVLKDAWKQRQSSLQSQARAIESYRQVVLGKKGGGVDSEKQEA